MKRAEKKGQIPLSREISHLSIILFLGLYIFAWSEHTLCEITRLLRSFLDFSSDMIIGPQPLADLLATLTLDILKLISVPFIGLMLLLIVVNGVQTKFLISVEKIQPKLSHISPLNGIKRIFSIKSIVEFLKSVLKFTILCVLVGYALKSRFDYFDDYQLMTSSKLLLFVKEQIVWLLCLIFVIGLFLAAGDYLIQRFNLMQTLKMSKQEIKEEQKELEGDPQIKAKMREIRRKKLRTNIAKTVPSANVIITNPTHYSVALYYDAKTMLAPKVVAKGVNFMALKIREIAREHKVPLVENAVLARSLYQTVDVEEEIPEQFYRAVARIIRYVMDLKGETL